MENGEKNHEEIREEIHEEEKMREDRDEPVNLKKEWSSDVLADKYILIDKSQKSRAIVCWCFRRKNHFLRRIASKYAKSVYPSIVTKFDISVQIIPYHQTLILI